MSAFAALSASEPSSVKKKTAYGAVSAIRLRSADSSGSAIEIGADSEARPVSHRCDAPVFRRDEADSVLIATFKQPKARDPERDSFAQAVERGPSVRSVRREDGRT